MPAYSPIESDGESQDRIEPSKWKYQYLLNSVYIFGWFLSSSLLSLYNRNLLGKEQFNFNYPLLIVSIHSFGHFALCSLFMGCNRKLIPRHRISRVDYLRRVVPTAVCTALDISMSNASLHYISLSFYTMVKSSTPIWVMLFAVALGLEKPRWSLFFVILVISCGVIFCIAGELKFSLAGFLLILGASILSALRWSLTQLLLQKEKMGMDNPIATLFYLSPISSALTGVLSMVIELRGDTGMQHSKFFQSLNSAAVSLGFVMVGGLLAFTMTVSEYFLIKSTSVMTLSVIGITKEVAVIGASMIVFGDELTLMNVFGVIVTFLGVSAYHRLKSANSHDHKQNEQELYFVSEFNENDE